MRSRTVLGEFQRRAMPTDDFSPEKPDWVPVAEVYADVRPLNGRELLQAQQLESVVTHKIECEYVAGITTEMRFVDGNRVFELSSVIDLDDAHRSLELMATVKNGPSGGEL